MVNRWNAWIAGLVCLELHSKQSYGCYISGSDTGVCDQRIKEEPDYRALEMPFCGSVVAPYYPCVPERKPIPPDRKFNQDGRWVNHTTLTKDRVFEQL